MSATKFRFLKAGTLLTALCAVSPASQGLTFNFNNTGGAAPGSSAAMGFQAAADLWSSLFSDHVTINLDIGFTSLGAGTLGGATSTFGFASYSAVGYRLDADRTSIFDDIAVSYLPSGSSFDLLINGTSDNPHGSGNSLFYVDNDGGANNSWIRMTTANAKAMGFSVGSGIDATIQFNSDYIWDFNGSDGIAANAFDFIGVAAHEIGHALGFISGVDILDINALNGPYSNLYSDNEFTYVTPLDLFRYSTASVAANGVIDWTADARAKYFSIDGGATNIAGFSTGVYNGDGRQASHWEDGLGLGIMDPTAARGEFLQITANDVLAFDVIGWNFRQQAAIPEPASLALLGIGLVGLGFARRRRT